MALFGPPNIEKLKSKGNIKGLVKALGYRKKQEIRNQASEALKEIGAPAVNSLITSLRGINLLKIEEAQKTIEKIGVQAIDSLFSILKNRQDSLLDKAEEILQNIGAPAVDSLITALKSNDDPLNKIAPRILGKIGDIRAIKPLIAAMEDNDQYVAGCAARALGYFKNDNVIKSLISTLKDIKKDYNVRKGAAQALGNIGDIRGLDPLISALNEPEFLLVKAVVEALGNIGDIRAVEPLINMKKTSQLVDIAKAEALGNIGDVRAVSTLEDLLKHELDSEKYCIERIKKLQINVSEREREMKRSNYNIHYLDQYYQWVSDLKSNVEYLERIRNDIKKITEALNNINSKNVAKSDKKDKQKSERERLAQLPRLMRECQHMWTVAPDKTCAICGKRDEDGLPFGCNKCFLIVCHNCIKLFE